MDNEKILNPNDFAIGGYINKDEYDRNLAILYNEGHMLTKDQSDKMLKTLEIIKQLQVEGKLNIPEMLENCGKNLVIPERKTT